MMKTALLTKTFLTLPFFMAFTVQAQIVNNGSFEDWTPSGGPEPFDWEYPTEWTSNNATTEFTMAGVEKSTDSYAGTYAAKLSTVNVFGEFKPGMMVNGVGTLNYADYTVDIITAGNDLAFIPDYLTGYYKFTSASVDDSAEVVLLFKKYNPDLEKQDTIQLIRKTLPQVDVYTDFNINIEDSGDTPDSIVVAFYSTKESSPLEGGQLWVDQLEGTFTGIEPPLCITGSYLFPNPSSGEVSFKSCDTEISRVRVFGPGGELVHQIEGNGKFVHADISTLQSGVYYVVLDFESGKQIRQKLIKIKPN